MLKLILFIEDRDPKHSLDNELIFNIIKPELEIFGFEIKSYITEDVIDIEVIDAE